jgi:hypothetical protein
MDTLSRQQEYCKINQSKLVGVIGQIANVHCESLIERNCQTDQDGRHQPATEQVFQKGKTTF